MKHLILLPKMRLTLILLFLCSFFFIHQSCTKIDTSSRLSGGLTDSQITMKFFDVPASAPAAIKRAANEMRLRNDENEYVVKFAKQNGYPVWDKALLQVRYDEPEPSLHRNVTGEGAIEDSVVVIPLVMPGDNKVSNFVVARINFYVVLDLYRGGDYDTYSFNNVADTAMNADKAALQLMILNKKVFGYKKFIVNDNRLFSDWPTYEKNDAHNKRLLTIDSLGAGVNKYTLPMCTTCTYKLCWCKDPNCIYSGFTCFDWFCTGGAPSGGEPPIPGLPSFPSGGGGGLPPPITPFPCPSTLDPNNPVPGCTTSPFPPIIIPEELDTRNPCDSMILALNNDQNFTSKFQQLNTDNIFFSGREWGFAVMNTNPHAYKDTFGVLGEGYLEYSFRMSDKIEGKVHSHFNGYNSIFSMGDLLDMGWLYHNGLMKNPNTYFEGMTSRLGGGFILKINDLNKFKVWSDSMFWDTTAPYKKRQRDFAAKGNDLVSYKDNPEMNEIQFLKFLVVGQFKKLNYFISQCGNFTAWQRKYHLKKISAR